MIMPKVFQRTYLPESFTYGGRVFKRDPNSEKCLTADGRNFMPSLAAIHIRDPYIVIEVLNRRLKGKNDFHGKPYRPVPYIFTTKKEASNG
jgi:hypothetical protein